MDAFVWPRLAAPPRALYRTANVGLALLYAMPIPYDTGRCCNWTVWTTSRLAYRWLRITLTAGSVARWRVLTYHHNLAWPCNPTTTMPRTHATANADSFFLRCPDALPCRCPHRMTTTPAGRVVVGCAFWLGWPAAALVGYLLRPPRTAITVCVQFSLVLDHLPTAVQYALKRIPERYAASRTAGLRATHAAFGFLVHPVHFYHTS